MSLLQTPLSSHISTTNNKLKLPWYDFLSKTESISDMVVESSPVVSSIDISISSALTSLQEIIVLPVFTYKLEVPFTTSPSL